MLFHDRGLQADTFGEQSVVVTEELDQRPFSMLQARQHVAGEPKGLWVAHIAHRLAGLAHHLVDDTLDLQAPAVIADQHLQRRVILVERAEQSGAEELGVEGWDGDADEGLLIHGEDLEEVAWPAPNGLAHTG